MSVIVHGMEMPENCDDCPFYFFGWYKSHEKGADEDFRFAETCLASYRRGLTGIRTDNKYTTPKGMKCPLTELPDRHGRLIDADVLTQKINEELAELIAIDAYDGGLRAGYRAVKKTIRLLPTVIPASEEGET